MKSPVKYFFIFILLIQFSCSPVNKKEENAEILTSTERIQLNGAEGLQALWTQYGVSDGVLKMSLHTDLNPLKPVSAKAELWLESKDTLGNLLTVFTNTYASGVFFVHLRNATPGIDLNLIINSNSFHWENKNENY